MDLTAEDLRNLAELLDALRDATTRTGIEVAATAPDYLTDGAGSMVGQVTCKTVDGDTTYVWSPGS